MVGHPLEKSGGGGAVLGLKVPEGTHQGREGPQLILVQKPEPKDTCSPALLSV